MPELPEVETVRLGLMPYVTGARIEQVTLRRKDLRFPFPKDMVRRLEGTVIERIERRAKYLLFRLSSGETLLSHLGMTGSWRFAEFVHKEKSRYYEPTIDARHDHAVLLIAHPTHGLMHLIYGDPRRFGFMDLIAGDGESPYLAGLGPEPLGNEFDAQSLQKRLGGRKAPIKAALLDQAVVAGIGNIYASEALYRAHIRPDAVAGSLGAARIEDLIAATRTVLTEAVEAGGSTLRDFRNAEGKGGYFQHRFSVYDREGEPCPTPGCTGTIVRIVQSGRSSFFCPICQKP
jgi:formamidopyrimidine-DNA glycosylase